MQRTLITWLCIAATVAAVCGEQGDARRNVFPGPSELKNDPEFAVLVDSLDISGHPFLVLGSQSSFGELRDELTLRLEQHGWAVETPRAFPADNVFSARKEDDCVYYWNMSPGSWAPAQEAEANRINPRFEQESSRYETVFNVFAIECL